ncbi:helix-turn-helix domain-containing protein [Citricoccus nitrophenolicus]|uniref:Helix-turn-helix domain-containing protein n=1 Tax=Citricoccus nitrophenolicus TaxID=863575 RepID=A0ABV0IKQ5_9MICC
MADDKTPAPDATAPDSLVRTPLRAERSMDVQTMKAFAHPLRMAMYSRLTDVGSATATALAQHLQESTGQTSYHLRQLEKLGLVEEDTSRGSGRERWWKPLGYRMHVEELGQDAANLRVMTSVLHEGLRRRMEAISAYLDVAPREPREWVDASVDTTTTMTMTLEQTRALSEELMEVIARHREALGSSGNSPAEEAESRRVRLYLSLFPLVEGEDAATP